MGDMLRMVTLDCFYDCRNDAFAREMFSAMVKMKIDGYLAAYPYGEMPVDKTDYFCHHDLVCKDEGGKLTPLIGYRSVSLERCLVHKVEFPMIAIARDDLKMPKFAAQIKKICDESNNKNIRLSFDSSFTVAPEGRQIAELRELVKGMHVNYHLDSKTPWVIAGGVVRFKMDRYYRFFGYDDFRVNDVPLPVVEMPFMFGEKVQMFFLKNFSDEALKFGEMYRLLWEKRIAIGKGEIPQIKAA